jgi:hypothetical protein
MTHHAMDHSGIDHGFAALRESFVVLSEFTIHAEPSKIPLDHPTTRKDLETRLIFRFFHDLQCPAEAFLDPFDERSGISSVGPQVSELQKPVFDGIQEELRSVRVLDIGRKD